jgi:hypothetical protein
MAKEVNGARCGHQRVFSAILWQGRYYLVSVVHVARSANIDQLVHSDHTVIYLD